MEKNRFRCMWPIVRKLLLILPLLNAMIISLAWGATLHHFEITSPNGSPLPLNWTAGVPVTVSITAYDTPTTIATTFNGNAELTYTLDHGPTLKCIRPTDIPFTNGVYWGQVTLFRADSYNGQINSFFVKYDLVNSPSSTVHVYPNSSTKMLVIAPGMTPYPGLNPDIAPSEVISGGATGQPDIQTAGTAITQISFFLCDDYWNTVTNTADGATGSVAIECSDPYPASLNGTSFSGGTRTVNLGAQGYPGEYRAANNFILYRVNDWAGQRIGITMTGKVPYALDVQKNRVPVKHAAACEGFTFTLGTDAQGRNIIAQGAIAGVPIATTIAAVDAYGNTMDSINYAAPLPTYTSVNLSANTDPPAGGWSLWPITTGNMEITRWNEGVSKPWVYVYKKATGSGQFLTATKDFGAGSRTGHSVNFTVLANAYARIVAIVPGMTPPDGAGAGGIYTAAYPSTPPPAQANVFNNFGVPVAQTAGIPFNIDAYSCDTYGNMVQTTNDGIRMSSSDRFAPNAAEVPIDPDDGCAHFTTFQLHTRGSAWISVTDINDTNILPGIIPAIQVEPGAYYGLQIMAPGQIAIEGSGNTNVGVEYAPVPINGWYSGVTKTGTMQLWDTMYSSMGMLENTYFPVTVQAVDLYGNYVHTAPDHRIELSSSSNNPGSIPNDAEPITRRLINGRAWFNVNINDRPTHFLLLRDTDDPAIKGDPDSFTQLRLWGIESTRYEVEVSTGGIFAWPWTFDVRVTLWNDSNEIIYGSTFFVMQAIVNPTAYPWQLALGEFEITSGWVIGGVANIVQSYHGSDPILYVLARPIPVPDPQTSYPIPGVSQMLHVSIENPDSTPTPTPEATPTATPTATHTATHTPSPGISAQTGEVKAYQNLLNPLRSGQTAKILFSLGEAGRVTVRIYTTQGRLVRTLMDDQDLAAGSHTLEWDGMVLNGATAASGIYIAHVKAPGIDRYVRIAVVK